MPATRRSRTSSGPISKGGQQSLSFNPSKVSKASSKDDSKSKSKPVSASIPSPSSLGHVSTAPAVAAQAAAELSSLKTDAKTRPSEADQLRAGDVSDAQIKKYWREREQERRTPRVHQEGLDVGEKILRLFDMSSQYGPAIGIARMKRWVRANKLGLSPPIEVLAVLLKEEGKNNPKVERAYVDDLMSSIAVAADDA